VSLKAVKTVVTLDPEDLVALQEILTDEDRDEALTFLRDVIGSKLTCAQAESHRPAFEGGTGKEGVHYLQKGEGHSLPSAEQSRP
jgi:hypothetical protein